MLPGTCLELLVPIPALEARGRREPPGGDFGIAVNPEFLREGTSVADFHDPPKTVIGQLDAESGDVGGGALHGPRRAACSACRCGGGDGEVRRQRLPCAEDRLRERDRRNCRALGLDSHEVMEVFLADSKLNICPRTCAGLRVRRFVPAEGPARHWCYAARRADMSVPILEHVLPVERGHCERAFDVVTRIGTAPGRPVRALVQAGNRRPAREPARRARRAADRQGLRSPDLRPDAVAVSRLIGANKEYVDAPFRTSRALLVDSAEGVARARRGVRRRHRRSGVSCALPRSDERDVVDLVRPPGSGRARAEERYVGLLGSTLVVVENLSVPFDRRVWQECLSLRAPAGR